MGNNKTVKNFIVNSKNNQEKLSETNTRTWGITIVSNFSEVYEDSISLYKRQKRKPSNNTEKYLLLERLNG